MTHTNAAKAFDRMDHTVLLQTLSDVGIRCPELLWFASYLSNRLIRTKVAGVISECLPISAGVPQGSVLGSLLFLLHFRNIPRLTSATTALFADDTLLYRDDCKGGTNDPCCGLQTAVTELSLWAVESWTTFNPLKSVEVCTGPHPSDSDLVPKSSVIPRHAKTKHIGADISSDLRWKDHLTSALSSVAPHVTLCLKLAYRLRLPAAVIRKFYVTFIQPRLEYCSALCCGPSSTLLKRLEKLQLMVARAMVKQASGGSHCSSLLQQVDLPTLAWHR